MTAPSRAAVGVGRCGAPSRARTALRRAGTAMIAAGILVGVWTVVVWRWEDPFTALYTTWEQHQLAGQYDRLRRSWRPPVRAAPARPEVQGGVNPERSGEHAPAPPVPIAVEAAAYRHDTHEGEAIGRIVIARIGLDMVLVDGTDEGSLEKGPGRDLETFMPGQHRLVYIAGHRTTYLAPFSHIDRIRPGDSIRIEVPYGTFVYRAVRHEIVPAGDLAVLRSPRHELLRLQACHPRFFATQRYLVDATLVKVIAPAH